MDMELLFGRTEIGIMGNGKLAEVMEEVQKLEKDGREYSGIFKDDKMHGEVKFILSRWKNIHEDL